MEIVGKKIAFLGDSVTEGAAASAPEKNFVSLMRSVYGAQALNYGAGGTRIARQKSPSENPVYDEDFLLRADKTDKGAEIIAVFGGTNDYGHGDAPLGTAADDTPYTFYGAVNCLYEKLKKDFPRALKVVITPLRRRNDADPFGEGKRKFATAPLAEYAAVERAAARAFGYPVLDFYALYDTDEKLKETFRRSADGLHPDDYGHAVIAEKIAAFLKAL